MKQIHIQGLLLGGLAAACLLAALLLARPSPAEDTSLPEPASALPLSSNQQVRKQQGEPPQALTLPQAQAMAPQGAYLPDTPQGFQLESAYYDPTEDCLTLLWTRPGAYDELRWSISPYGASHVPRLTAVADLENYDLSRYPIPRADSVPEALREVVDHPIFPGEELSQEAVQRRAYTLEDAGDSQGPRMSFGVRYGDMVVELTAKGVDPGWVYGQLATLPGSADQT